MTAPRWTFVIAYYNEADYLADTLKSLGDQTLKRFRLILIDNGSTDGSGEIARNVAATLDGVEARHLTEATPGKIHALEAAMPHIDTEFVAFGDADTFYPPDYLGVAQATYDKGPDDLVAVMAVDVPAPPDGREARRRRFVRSAVASRLWPKQTHTGGFGQTFRTAALKAAGGYSHKYWPYVLMDHEIMQRVLKQGRAAYPYELWCIPSPRRSDRRRVRWTMGERLLYHFTPFAAKDWYFYRFLGPRLAQRKLTHLNLREKPWEGDGKVG
ncbi:glycosyltransferase family 2 protein [Stakelama marina]|uniref:Glycosyltransferase family 2 protein n=1 Tax=Stakelama marina TaxID=2826939 RepID=A0A8T4ICM6_9SPHN|nr:glycosyltransferase family 2 protein [Stakelama marina]MBR0552310.1 glycosyltransferase family 2 protein [Stakelama marina]